MQEKTLTMNRVLCAVLTMMLMLALVPTYAFAAGDEAESDFDIEAAMKSKTTEEFYNWLTEQQNSGLCPICGEPDSNECIPYVLADLEENIDDPSYWYSHE